MNFNYSYKAFLITSLLVGNLILLLVSVKLQKQTGDEELDASPVEYVEILPEDLEELAMAEQEQVKIETNTAYNEAEDFINEIEEGRNETLEEEPTLADFQQTSFSSGGNTNFSKAQEALEDVKEKLEESVATREKPRTKSGLNRKTTISYSLKDRMAMELPNPVYTCDAGGKIVITIEVDALGKIKKADYNPVLSTTSNGCLIDAALEYTNRSRFSTKGDRVKQLGTITYHFPGQE